MADPMIPTPQDAALLLQDTATKTAAFNSAGLDLGEGFAPGGVGRPVAGVIDVDAADRANSDETYSYKLQESADDSTYTDAGASETVPVSGAAATLGVVIVKAVIKKRYVRLVLTTGGTTPSITYKAWLNPNVG